MQDSSPFAKRCYKALCKVPAGKVTTYSELARAIGTKAVRAVGTAMAKNPNAPKVPCHRVVRSDGKLGGYALGLRRKVALLRSEGVEVNGERVENFEKYFHRF